VKWQDRCSQRDGLPPDQSAYKAGQSVGFRHGGSELIKQIFRDRPE